MLLYYVYGLTLTAYSYTYAYARVRIVWKIVDIWFCGSVLEGFQHYKVYMLALFDHAYDHIYICISIEFYPSLTHLHFQIGLRLVKGLIVAPG